jgi:hypothetical protein
MSLIRKRSLVAEKIHTQNQKPKTKNRVLPLSYPDSAPVHSAADENAALWSSHP